MDFSQLLALLADLQVKLQDVEAFAKAEYDKGFADGVASIVIEPPAEDDKDIKIAELEAKVSELDAQLSSLRDQLALVPQQIHDAVMAEDARLAEQIKPLLEQLSALLP